jgi:hypothetical protein
MNSTHVNPFKSLLKSRQGSDCCYFIQNCHLLNEEVMSELLALKSEIHNSTKLSPLIPTTIKSLKFDQMTKNASNIITPDAINNSNYYNPIFLHIPHN